MSPDEARFAAQLLERADVELVPMRPLSEPATALAVALGHPAYDCIYLALAEDLSCDLVTGDRRLSAKAVLAGHKSKILALTTSAFP